MNKQGEKSYSIFIATYKNTDTQNILTWEFGANFVFSSAQHRPAMKSELLNQAGEYKAQGTYMHSM